MEWGLFFVIAALSSKAGHMGSRDWLLTLPANLPKEKGTGVALVVSSFSYFRADSFQQETKYEAATVKM